MEVRFKKGTVITATTPDGHFWKFNDNDIFTDKTESGHNELHGTDGQKCYFPKDKDIMSGCGFPENMFDVK